MFVVDTNIFVYASNRDVPEHARAAELVEGFRGRVAPWFITWSIVYELLRVVTHPRVLARPYTMAQAWRFVDAVLASPALQILVDTPRHAAVLGELIATTPGLSGSVMHDAHTVALMHEHGVRRIYTRDADFRRFPQIEVIDPIGSGGPGGPYGRAA